jgi:hypothetical protein
LIQKSARPDSIVAREPILAEFCNNIGTNSTKKPGQIISAYRGKADSIETSLFSL